MTTQRDITVLQGATACGSIAFSHGPTAAVSTFDGVEATLEDPTFDCIEAGTRVHLVGQGECCQFYQGVYDVVASAGGVLGLALRCGEEPAGELANVVIAQAMDLHGFSLYGSVFSGVSPSGYARGCISKGGRHLAIQGKVSVAYGDSVSMPDAGLSGATVLSVSSSETHTVLTLDTPATSSVACSAPAAVAIGPGCLANFEFDINPDCGLAQYCLKADFPATFGECCTECVPLGCYEVVLVEGGRAPAHYPQGNYSSWARPVMKGQIFAQPSMALTEK